MDHSTIVTHPKGNKTRYEFVNGVTTQETQGYDTPDASTVSYTYDPITVALASTTDALGQVWRFEYDGRGNQLRAIDPLGRRTSATYNESNQVMTATDAAGITTTTTYAPNGNILSVSRPLVGTTPAQSAVTRWEYGDAAHPEDATAVTDANGKTSHITYDTYGNITSTTDPTGRKTTSSYNVLGWQTAVVSPAGNVAGADPADRTTTFGPFTGFGVPKQVTDPLGHHTSYVFDDNENVTSVTDPDARTTTTTYDQANQPVTVTRPDGSSITNAYDANGNPITYTDGLGHATSYGYDAADRPASVTDAAGRATTNTYDVAGRLTHIVQPAAAGPGTVTTTNTYDAADQLLAADHSDPATPDVSYTYDPAGHVTSMSDGTGTSTYTYDSLGRLTNHGAGSGKTVTYGYDLAGNVTSLTYPDGVGTVTRSHDDAGRLTGVTDWLGNTNTFSYDANGTWSGTSYGNGVTSTRQHDSTGWLTQIAYAQGQNSLATYTYTRSAAGLVATATPSLSTPGGEDTYAYTANAQLRSREGAASTNTWEYDAADRPTRLPDGTTLAYNNVDELTTLTPPTGEASSFSYDQRGNRISKTTGTQTENYTWNQNNQLTAYTNPTGQTTTYTYDGTGLRATKTLPGTSTPQTMTWDNITSAVPLLLSDTDAYYVYGPGDTPLEQIRPAATGAPEATWLHGDRLASTRILTNTTGTITGEYSYDAYGKTLTHTGTTTTPLQHNGQYADTETGLTYLRARYYDPTTTTFISLDPLYAETHERYTYATGNPITHTDPTGLFWEEVADFLNPVSIAKDFFQLEADYYNQTGDAPTAIAIGVLGVSINTVALIGGGLAGKYAARGAAKWLSKRLLKKCVSPAAPVGKPFSRFTVNGAGENTLHLRAGTKSLEVSPHAAKRMNQRGVSIEAAEATLQQTPFQYFHEGIWKMGYYNPSTKLFLGAVDGRVTTVISNASTNYIRNIRAAKP